MLQVADTVPPAADMEHPAADTEPRLGHQPVATGRVRPRMVAISTVSRCLTVVLPSTKGTGGNTMEMSSMSSGGGGGAQTSVLDECRAIDNELRGLNGRLEEL